MANTVLLQGSFDGGVRKDVARDQLPLNALWSATDMLPNLSYAGIAGRLRERGGWGNYSDDIAATVATSAYVIAGIVAPFSDATAHVTFDEDGRAIKIATDGSGDVTDVAACAVAVQNPVFHRDKVIVPASTPKKITSSAGTLSVANLGGSPPGGLYGTVWNDRTLLARSSANTNRMWFSDPGDPETWDTTDGYWDFSFPIVGVDTVGKVILVFHESHVSRLIGNVPPPQGDLFADDPKWFVGCADARSIAKWGGKLLWASPEGIYVTDGAAYDDLTVRCGMLSYWQETMSAYASSTWTVVGGVLRDHYFVVVMDGSTFKAGAMIDLRRQTWWPITNVDARCMYVGQGAADELYFGRRGAARVAKLSSVFMPSSTVKADGDGDAVVGTAETRFYGSSLPTLKGWHRLFVWHYLRDYATDNPTCTVTYVDTPEKTSYSNFPAGTATLAENTEGTREPFNCGFSSRGIGLKFTRANAGDWHLNTIEADVHSKEGSS